MISEQKILPGQIVAYPPYGTVSHEFVEFNYGKPTKEELKQKAIRNISEILFHVRYRKQQKHSQERCPEGGVCVEAKY